MAEKNKDDTPDAEAAPKNVGRKKLLMLGAGLIGLIILSVALTTAIFSSMQPDKVEPTPAAKTGALAGAPAGEKEMAELKAQIEQQAAAIARLEQETISLREASSARQLQHVLAGQERNFQEFLAAMKEGMNDLANMVRGSRTWLEHYEGRLDEVIAQSRARAASLSRPPEEAPVQLEP